jgi:hypothetical protein
MEDENPVVKSVVVLRYVNTEDKKIIVRNAAVNLKEII